MFRPLSGFKAQCDDVAILVAADFDEYRVLLQTPGGIVQGRRQFTEAKAKEHACAMAASYLKEKCGDKPLPPDLDWSPLGSADWLSWNP
jgi:hypothetical protein